MKILWTRESVCMGDDYTAPNPRTEEIDHMLTVADLLDRAAGYVRPMSGAVWAVWAEGILVGFLELGSSLVGFLELGSSGELLRSEPVLEGPLLMQSKPFPTLHVHCFYYTMGDFRYRQGRDGPVVEKFPEHCTLLDKVKASLKQL